MFRKPVIYLVLLAGLLLTAALASAQEEGGQRADAAPRVRVAHLAPFADAVADTAVSITVNGDELLSDFKYADFSDYVTLDGPGDIDVAVLLNGSPVIEETLTVSDDMDYTVAAIGDGVNQPLALWALVDDNSAPAAGQAHLRVAHAAPFAANLDDTRVDICTQAGGLVNGLAGVPFNVDSGFFPLPAGTYDLRIAAYNATTPCSGATIIDPLPVTLAEGSISSVFAIGDAANQPPGLLALGAGLLPQVHVRVNHLAPFAMEMADTAVAVTVNGDTVVDDFQFTEFTDYLPLPYAGDYDVAVLAGGTEVISATLSVGAGMEYAVSAIGGANGWPLEFFVLEDDNSAPAAGNAHLRIAHTAPFAAGLADTEVDICTQDGNLVAGLAAVPYKVASGYLPLPAGTYDLKVALADTTPCAGLPIIDPDPVTLDEGAVVTVYAFGDGANQAPGLLAVPVGVLDVNGPEVRVVHVAPFAPAINATRVSLALNGQALPGQLAYLEDTGYLPLPAAGAYLVEVLAGGTPAISETIAFGAGMSYTVAAIGDGTNQPLELLVLSDDRSEPASGEAKLRIVHAAPFAADIDDTRVDVCTQDGDLVAGLAGVPYGVDTGFLGLPAGSYDLVVKAAASEPCTGEAIIDLPPLTVPAGALATVFAVGGANGQMPGAYSPELGRLGIPYMLYLPIVRG